MSTVERRSCSAISPKPSMLMSVVSTRTLGHRDAHFLYRPTPHDLCRQRFADVFRLQMRLHVFETRNALAVQRNENVADHHSCFVCRASGFDFEDDCASLFLALQRSAKRLGQANRLQAEAKIAARNVALLQQSIHDAVDLRGRNDDRAKARETRRCDSNDVSLCIHDCTTDCCRLKTYVQAYVRSKRRAGTRAALGCHEANNAEGSDRTTCPSATDNQGEMTGLQGFHGTQFCGARYGFRALQDGEVRRSIAARKVGADNAAVRQRHLNLFVAAQGVLGRDDNTGAPNHPARRST